MKLDTYGRPIAGMQRSVIGRITFDPFPDEERQDFVLVLRSLQENHDIAGYAGVLIQETVDHTDNLFVPAVHSCGDLSHLSRGDVVYLQPTGHVRTLYRRESRHNVIFATDHCNSLCLMCSQPPRDVDESGKMAEHLRLISLMDPNTPELGITGGEPTLLGNDFLRLISACKEQLPNTSLHVLTNGRFFYYTEFTRNLADINHPDLMLGIPLYSDMDSIHDHVVQARGAFNETMIGLHNLGRHSVKVEIRVVIHRLTYQRLLALAEFIYRNLSFASHIALMGLETMGFAISNIDQLWIDPHDYRNELALATDFLASRGMHVSIYNHQLCVVPRELWRFCRKSISDWKNLYLPVCDACGVKYDCGGFFSSSVNRNRVSKHLSPI